MHSRVVFVLKALAFSLVLLGVLGPGYGVLIPQPNSTFQWLTSSWGGCLHRDPGACCDCYMLRNVTCIFKETGSEIPAFYCRKLVGAKPAQKESCPKCQQDCVHSTWGKWSSCSQTCAPATRYRIRQILLRPQAEGEECGPLIEREECPNFPSCEFVDPRPKYSWVAGNWTGCRKVRDDADCGDGKRYREVYCSSRNAEHMVDKFCYHYQPDVLKPVKQVDCHIPCNCLMGPWSAWAPCSKSCYKGGGEFVGYQTRARNVLEEKERGGVGCPAERESRECDLNHLRRCDRFTWHTTDWSECYKPYTEGDPGLETCGSGIQTRQVFCIKEGEPTKRPVEEILCVQDSWLFENTTHMIKPTERKACQVPCPDDCQLGEWQNWSGCTKSCGTGGTHTRLKPVLVPASPGGASCDTRIETIKCEGNTPCLWWHKGRWAGCLLEDQSTACGIGSTVRNVYCLNSLDEILPDDNCTAEIGSRPRERDKCRVPCAEDCVLSEWSEWGDCSATCGAQGGTQHRTREIISQTKPGRPCISQKDLRQNQVCNQKVCRLSLWQVSAWSTCVWRANGTMACGEGTGLQQRTVQCEQDPGYKVNDTLCDPAAKPETERVCSAPCPVDCQRSPWTSWTQCSHTCGSHSRKFKHSSVLQVALHGGLACPAQSRIDGVIVRHKKCNVPDCYMYRWMASEWSHCETQVDSCGLGVHVRNVTCVRIDTESSTLALDVNCFESGAGRPPPNEGQCYFPCKGDCQESTWSDYSPCSHSCGSSAGSRYRTKRIINIDPTLPLELQCPHLTAQSLNDTVECGRQPCPVYEWQVGVWGSCVVHQQNKNGEHCGNGIQRRHVICIRDNATHVPSHHCDSVLAMPHKYKPCSIDCPVDCVHGEWSAWSNCSHACGMGTVSRSRSVKEDYNYGGRQCPDLEQIDVCMLRDCEELEWKVSWWGDCEPFYAMPCHKGLKHRTVTCPAGENFEDECAKRGPKPVNEMDCKAPCLGDCKMSEWSAFSPCACDTSLMFRTREVLRNPLPSGEQCGPLNETESCECPRYILDIGDFNSCVMQRGNQLECGAGVRRRTINCIRDSDGVGVSMKHCNSTNIILAKTCEVPCPIDCKVGEFSPWVPCTEKCGVRAMKSRRRVIFEQANSHGRQCPSRETLNQTTTCHTTLCYTYHWERGAWSLCSIAEDGCGVGLRTRIIECRRSDGAIVEKKYCFLQEEGIKAQRLEDVNLEDQALLDLGTEESCGLPCPGDCEMSEWSDFSPCFKNCKHSSHKGAQVRTRVVLKLDSGGLPCPNGTQLDARKCPGREALCPLFYWKAENWTSYYSRKIYCAMHEEIRVMGGCLAHQRPSSHIDCRKKCSQYASCTEGECRCNQGFSGTGRECLPEFGCVESAHCIINNTYCDLPTKECVCGDGSLPYKGTYCAAFDPDLKRQEEGNSLNTLFIYVLIACLCALLLLAIVATVCLIRKRRNDKESRKNNFTPHQSIPGLNKIDNLEAEQKNNEINSENASMNKSTISSSNPSKNFINENSQNSVYHTNKFSRVDNSAASNTPSPNLSNKVNTGKEEAKGNLIPNWLPPQHATPPRQQATPPRQQATPTPRQPVPLPRKHIQQPIMDADAPMFGSVASRGPPKRPPPDIPGPPPVLTERRNINRSPGPPGYNPVTSRRPSPAGSDSPKLITFKPDPEPLPDPRLWLEEEEIPNPNPWGITYTNPAPEPKPPQRMEPHRGQNGAPPKKGRNPPGRTNMVTPKQPYPEPRSAMKTLSNEKKDPGATQNLLLYCDTLIADLERVAKS